MGCNPSKGGGDGRTERSTTMNVKAGEDKLEVAIKLKRRYQNVFCESVDASRPVAKRPAMAKDAATTAFLTRALRQNFVFASLDEVEVSRVAEYCEKKHVAKGLHSPGVP